MRQRGSLGLALAVVTMALPARAAAKDDRPTMALMSVNRGTGITRGQTDTLEQVLLTALDGTGRFKVIGRADINALLTLEQQKQIAGCNDASCMAQIAGALGAKYVAAADIGKLGTLIVVDLRVIDVATANVIVRAQQMVDSLDALPGACQTLANEVAKRIGEGNATMAQARPAPAVVLPPTPPAPAQALAHPERKRGRASASPPGVLLEKTAHPERSPTALSSGGVEGRAQSAPHRPSGPALTQIPSGHPSGKPAVPAAALAPAPKAHGHGLAISMIVTGVLAAGVGAYFEYSASSLTTSIANTPRPAAQVNADIGTVGHDETTASILLPIGGALAITGIILAIVN